MWGLHAATKTWLFQCCHVSAQTIKVNIGGDLAWRICTDSLRKSQKNGLLIKYQIKIRTISHGHGGEGGGGVQTPSRKGQTSHTPHTHTQPEWGQEKFPRELFPILTVRATYIMEENRRGGYITSSQLRLLSHEGYITSSQLRLLSHVGYITSYQLRLLSHGGYITTFSTPSVPWVIHYNLLNTFCPMSDTLHPLKHILSHVWCILYIL